MQLDQETEESLETLSEIMEIEPITHKKKKSYLESVFSCYPSHTDLTKYEIKKFNKLKKEVNISFNKEDEKHLNLLKSLFKICFEEDCKIDENTIKNDCWKKIGFQNANPISDLRGGGYLSLKTLYEFIKTIKRDELEEMCEESKEFPLAIVSISITFFLKKYFHMGDISFFICKNELCSRKALKNFCGFLTENRLIFNEIHNLLVKDIYQFWIVNKEAKNWTLLDFRACQETIEKKFDMNCDLFNSFHKFTRLYLH